MISILLQNGASVLAKTEPGFSAIQEATSYGDRELIKTILKSRHEQYVALVKEKRDILLAVLNEVDDFYMEMSWDFHTWSINWVKIFSTFSDKALSTR